VLVPMIDIRTDPINRTWLQNEHMIAPSNSDWLFPQPDSKAPNVCGHEDPSWLP
jgi:hypothetical protein